jgi:steroid 5-alpha reductase family enzyme
MNALLASACVTFVAFTLLWLLSLKRKDAGIVDFYWGPGFVLIGWLAVGISGRFDVFTLTFLAGLTTWGLRLGWHMTARHSGTEDARYADMRRRHGAAFPSRSLWMVFWLQAAIQWLAASPALTLAVSAPTPSRWLMWLGAGLFAAGFLLEVAADREVERFKADSASRGRLLTTGLRAVVRYPAYLGEIVLQWGLGLMAFAISGNPLAFVGPALMHGLIWKLSGVPLLEAQFAKREGFAEWTARTNALWPRIGR